MSSRSCPSKVTQELLGPTLLPHSSRVMDPFSPGTLCSVGSWALCTLCPGERFWAREACTSLTILSSSAMGGGGGLGLSKPTPAAATVEPPPPPPSARLAGINTITITWSPGGQLPATSRLLHWPPAKAAGGGGVQGRRADTESSGQLSSGRAAAVPTPGPSPAAPRPSSTLPLWNSQRLWRSGITRWLRCRLDTREGRPPSWLQRHREGETLRGRAPARAPGPGGAWGGRARPRTQPASQRRMPRAHRVRPGTPGVPAFPHRGPGAVKVARRRPQAPPRACNVCWAGGGESPSGSLRRDQQLCPCPPLGRWPGIHQGGTLAPGDRRPERTHCHA